MGVFQVHSLCYVPPFRSANFVLKSCKSVFWDKNMAELQETLWHTRDASQLWKKKKELGKQGYYSLTLLIHWLIWISFLSVLGKQKINSGEWNRLLQIFFQLSVFLKKICWLKRMKIATEISTALLCPTAKSYISILLLEPMIALLHVNHLQCITKGTAVLIIIM